MTHFVQSCGLIICHRSFYKGCLEIFPIMLALCLMLSETYYAQNYAGIIVLSLYSMGKRIDDEYNTICQCFTCQLLPFIISCSYICSLSTNILPSNWFAFSHSPIFYPTIILPCRIIISSTASVLFIQQLRS